MHNKRGLLIVFYLIITLLCFSACGAVSDEPAKENVYLTMTTGGTGGTYYPFGSALGSAIEAATDYIKVNIIASGASIENIMLIGDNLAQLAIVQTDVIDYAYNATFIWEDDAVTNMRMLMSLYPEACQLVVDSDSNIYSVADLAGKHVSTGNIGSGVEANAMQILGAYGLTIDDIEQEHLSFTFSADAMRNKTIDAFFVTAGVPNEAVMDLQQSCDIRIIDLDETVIDELVAKYPFFTKVTLTGDDYTFLETPVNTVSIMATLIANSDLDEGVVYDVVKSIIEGKDGITAAHAKGELISPESAVVDAGIDFHPGALRYYREIGVLPADKDGYLLLSNELTGEIVFRAKVNDGEQFSVSYIHSVNKSPVTEYYRIKDGNIYLTEQRFQAFGAGMETSPAQGQNMRMEEGDIVIDGFSRHIPYLSYFVGRIAEHTLEWREKSIRLDGLCEPGQPVLFTVSKSSKVI